MAEQGEVLPWNNRCILEPEIKNIAYKVDGFSLSPFSLKELKEFCFLATGQIASPGAKMYIGYEVDWSHVRMTQVCPAKGLSTRFGI